MRSGRAQENCHPYSVRSWLRSAFAKVVIVSVSILTMLSLNPVSANADAYYNGILVGGRIETEYLNRGGPAVVGYPTTAELNALNGGKFQVFANNASIYWHANVAGGWAKLVGGAIRDKWGEWGWEGGSLGYPTSSEFSVVNGGAGNHFEGGSIYWKASTGAHPVWGAIRDQWAAQGWENGALGYPVTDEYEIAGGYQQVFEGGTLSWNVGPEPDDDPNGTDPLIGADDPYNKFASRWIRTTPGTGTRCSSPGPDGTIMCIQVGSSTNNWTDPTIATRMPEGDEPQVTEPESGEPQVTEPEPGELTETPEPSSAPTSGSSLPSSLTPSAEVSTPFTTTTPSTTASSSPPSVEESPILGTPTSTAVPQSRPFPARTQAPVGVPEPADPARDTSSENAFYSGNTWCSNKQLGWTIGKRFYGCETKRYAIRYHREYQGSIYTVGWEKGFVYEDVKPAVKSQNVSQRVKFNRKVVTGVAGGATVSFDLSAQGSHGHSATLSNGQQTKALNTGPTFSFDLSANLAPQSQKKELVTSAGTFQFKDAGFSIDSDKVDFAFPDARCDSFTYIYSNEPGCVMAPRAYANNFPVLDLTTTKNWAPQLYDHVLSAQNSGLPGSPVGVYTGVAVVRPLERIVYQSRQHKDNRAASCPSGKAGFNKPDPKSQWQCDEYPFAITAQGGSSNPNGGRTHHWCNITSLPTNVINPTGYSACIIPASQNRDGGGLIPPFHRENRILYTHDDPDDGYLVQPYHV